jgi:hypothetical protein
MKLVSSVPLVRKRTRRSKFSVLYNDAFLSLIIYYYNIPLPRGPGPKKKKKKTKRQRTWDKLPVWIKKKRPILHGDTKYLLGTVV